MGIGIMSHMSGSDRKKVSGGLPRKSMSPGSSQHVREALSHESGYKPKRKSVSPGSSPKPTKKLSHESNATYRARIAGRTDQLDPDGNPNPFRFTILDYMTHQGNTLVKINYPDCTNYEGNKLLLIARNINEIRAWNKLDPHFIEGRTNGMVARFEPTDFGWVLGMSALRTLLPRK